MNLKGAERSGQTPQKAKNRHKPQKGVKNSVQFSQ